MNEKKPQFGLKALLIGVAGAAAVFAFIRAAPVVALIIFVMGLWFAFESGLVFDLVNRPLERAAKKHTWPILLMPVWILLALTLAFAMPYLIVLVLQYAR